MTIGQTLDIFFWRGQ